MKKYLIFLLFYSVLLTIAWLSVQERFSSISTMHLNEERALHKSILTTSEKHFKLLSDTLLHEVVMTDEILNLLHEIVYGDESQQGVRRGQLYRALYKTYNRIKKQSIRQFHFHYPDGKSMLRFHYPEKADDLLSDIRPSIANAMKFKETHGYEEGRAYSGFRHVYPLSQGGTPVGSVELSNGFQHINRILSKNDVDSGVYRMMIHKKSKFYKQLFATQKELFAESALSKDYVFEKSDSLLFHEAESNIVVPDYIISIQEELKNLPDFYTDFSNGIDFSLVASLNDECYAVHFYNVLNTSQEHAAYIIVFVKDIFLNDLQKKSIIVFTIVSILLFFILLFLFIAAKYKYKEKKTARRMLMISDNILEGIYITDDKGTLTFINSAALNMLGFQENEILNRNAHDIFHVSSGTYSTKVCSILESVHSGKRLRFDEVIFKTKNKTQFYVELSCTPVNKSGKITSIINIFNDITDKKQKDDELINAHLALKEANSILLRQVESDGLTGIANRRFFDKSFDRIWKSAQRDGSSMSILFIDIDFFKSYNDTYGHPKGDECLIKVAKTIESSCLRPDDITARYGGEEFIALLPNATLKNAIYVAERMQKNISDLEIAHETSSISLYLTVSIGIFSGKWSAESSIEKFMILVDKKLYESKERGRNTITY